MDKADRVVIRKFTPGDRLALRELCSDTAFMGRPVEVFWKDRELFADWTTLYYTDYEPQSIFLAEYETKIVGYLMGCRKEEDYQKIFSQKIFPSLLGRSFNSLLWRRQASGIFFFNLARSFLCGEFNRPDFSHIYPAHLHINVDKDFRKAGLGSLLIESFLNYLIDSKVEAVRLATISKQANRFFQRCGFNLLYRRRVTYFDYLSRENIYLSIYGKILE